MSELLDDLIAATAQSLNRANQQLSDAEGNEVAYVVTDLEVSIPFGGLAVENNVVSVQLPDMDRPPEGAHYVRFSVRSVPQTVASPEPVPGDGIPDVTNSRLNKGLMSLARSGVRAESVRVKFDEDSKLPVGTITKVAKARASDSDPSRITLTVAGKEPTLEATDSPGEGSPSVAAKGTPLEQIHGIGPRFAAQLGTVGIRTVEDLKDVDARTVAEALSISEARAAELVKAAKKIAR